MRKLLLLGLMLLLIAGCKKKTKARTADSTPTPAASGSGPGLHAPAPGGVVQGVRMAAGRVVSENELKNIHIYVEYASGASGRMPSVQEITAAIQKEDRKAYQLVQEGAIVLTGARSRENIWAYTPKPQSIAGYHLMVSSNGVERISEQDLRQRLKSEGGR
jgi:hypothetical protein